MALNKVQIIGNVGHTPEVKESQNGKWATFRIATTDRAYTKKDGTQVPERTEWHNIVVNGGLVSVVENYVARGTKLYIEGKLRTRKYTGKDGVERTVTEVHVSDMELLTPKEKTQQGAAERAPEAPQRQPQPDDDDELPF
jgi:single-strand DNA-binding protein